ncbi:hypothetical protein Q1695_012337 [Nippostrongylus brasiliensis]|nr:hypothetical protein Q1695_012337 [Nippostrongylus brasiliensis]
MSERHGIIPGRMHSNDIISVEARVARNDYEDGIKYYRGHSDETGDGFAMVIITPTQQQWLQKYGRTGVCIDDTFNLTGYNLRVAVVVLVNEWDMGVPGGYLLSFRMTAKEVRVLFAEVRKVVPDFEPAFFMSDDTNTFYNGFVQEFPETQSVKLLCAFHVVQAVLRNANSKLRAITRLVRRRCADGYHTDGTVLLNNLTHTRPE